MKLGALCAIVLLVLTVAADGRARAQVTAPVSGAVAKPVGFDISLPFAAGEPIYITAGYSPSGGSSYHDGTNSASSANDYYALDLIMLDHPDNGRGQPILAAASGTVVRAGWATAGWASYGQRVIIQHDYTGDGNTYVSLYAHMDSLAVTEGQSVAKGQPIGTLGGSSNGSLTGLGFHLHWAIHRNSSIGGSGTGGSYGGNAVVPELVDAYGLLTPGQTLVSANTGLPAAPCNVIAAAGETVLDDDGPCFRRFGPASFWHDEETGYSSHSVWTYTIADAQPDNWVRWNLHYDQAGSYELWAYMPPGFGSATQARYVVTHGGQSTDITADQSSVTDGWLSLGTLSFAAGGDQYVELADNTGEAYTGPDGTTIAFDALKIAPASGGGGDAGPDAPDAGNGGGGSPDAGSGGGGGGGGSADGGGDDGSMSGGCAATSRGGALPGLVWLVVGLFVATRRRLSATRF